MKKTYLTDSQKEDFDSRLTSAYSPHRIRIQRPHIQPDGHESGSPTRHSIRLKVPPLARLSLIVQDDILAGKKFKCDKTEREIIVFDVPIKWGKSGGLKVPPSAPTLIRNHAHGFFRFAHARGRKITLPRSKNSFYFLISAAGSSRSVSFFRPLPALQLKFEFRSRFFPYLGKPGSPCGIYGAMYLRLCAAVASSLTKLGSVNRGAAKRRDASCQTQRQKQKKRDSVPLSLSLLPKVVNSLRFPEKRRPPFLNLISPTDQFVFGPPTRPVSLALSGAGKKEEKEENGNKRVAATSPLHYTERWEDGGVFVFLRPRSGECGRFSFDRGGWASRSASRPRFPAPVAQQDIFAQLKFVGRERVIDRDGKEAEAANDPAPATKFAVSLAALHGGGGGGGVFAAHKLVQKPFASSAGADKKSLYKILRSFPALLSLSYGSAHREEDVKLYCTACLRTQGAAVAGPVMVKTFSVSLSVSLLCSFEPCRRLSSFLQSGVEKKMADGDFNFDSVGIPSRALLGFIPWNNPMI